MKVNLSKYQDKIKCCIFALRLLLLRNEFLCNFFFIIISFNFIYFLIDEKLLYNFVLVTAVQHESFIIIYIYIPSILHLPPLPPSYPSRSSQSARLGPLCYLATSHQLSILHMVVYICQCNFLNLSHPHLPPLCPQVPSLLGSSIPFL